MAKKYCLEEIIQLLLEAGARGGIQLQELVTPNTTVTDEDPACHGWHGIEGLRDFRFGIRDCGVMYAHGKW
ncbi:Protein of unknown function [Pyronema omphalodes CBS 100304]|uniref:Uncharacterized protein n=1 Tax=Pyronema omphalodes (strain CBS 100304) TaxID=1076935 RepID=U4LPK3_PYROM|nr:Protein of unknown function [Pyronema omphalodes CBS 100304]